MSFIDLLRASRSKPVAAVHKFLTNYDPKNPQRLYAFVEGIADSAFYRAHLRPYIKDHSDLFIYSCDGKSQVYDAYTKIMLRYSSCSRVLFFVDKDLDDILGIAWPADPRIFITDYYSIENYVVQRAALSFFFVNYIKTHKVTFDVDNILSHFDEQLQKFHKLILPIMAWIVVMRRSGNRVFLTETNMEELFHIRDLVITKKSRRNAIAYLLRVTNARNTGIVWRDVRKVCRELSRMEAKRYIRGKFELWWFIKFTRRLVDDLVKVSAEDHGSISLRSQMNEANCIQLLSSGVPIPHSLSSFLTFHLDRISSPTDTEASQGQGAAARIIRRLFG